MPKRLTYKEVIDALKRLGFEYLRTKGSHQVWFGKDRTDQTRAVVIAPHRYSDVVRPGTLASIIRQSGHSKEEFFRRKSQS